MPIDHEFGGNILRSSCPSLKATYAFTIALRSHFKNLSCVVQALTAGPFGPNVAAQRWLNCRSKSRLKQARLSSARLGCSP